MDKLFINYLSKQLNADIKNYYPISGGDISSAFLLETFSEKFFVKVNRNLNAFDMFHKEKNGLEAIASIGTIKTPQVITIDQHNTYTYLILEYIESKNASEKDMETLGHQLAQLHLRSQNNFTGFKEDNFIGTLSQSNKIHEYWIDFYIKERLHPQLKLAKGLGLLKSNEIPSDETMYRKLKHYLFNCKPSLLHGDLWSGNYLIAKDGTPYLIDPAVYYGHSEIDIAMSKLFGGFSNTFYKAYQKLIPFNTYTEDRIQLYQLYYLLVHLNMFGSSYYGAVKKILNHYFK